MCGIVGAVSERNITGILIEGLKRLEYRGYDSAGIAVVSNIASNKSNSEIKICKREGKVVNVEEAIAREGLKGNTGIAHTRWATHGVPSEINAHPHFSQDGRIALVHNGIIENFQKLREQLVPKGVECVSETDTEIAAHLIADLVSQGKNLTEAVKEAANNFEGHSGFVVIDQQEPDKIVALRSGSPLVIGVGIGENFIASDALALRQVTDRVIYLEDGDLVELSTQAINIFDVDGKPVERAITQLKDNDSRADKDGHSHFMYKEIFEQPAVLAKTLEGRLSPDDLSALFSEEEKEKLKNIQSVHIIACGTSYHAGMIAKHWIEEVANIPCGVDIASEYRYRKVLIGKNTLFLSVSQSGETADTLAALRARKDQYLTTMTVCNVDGSSLVRESDIKLLTRAGVEIGVASTKAFTTQLAALQIFALFLAQQRGEDKNKISQWVDNLHQLPGLVQQALLLDRPLRDIAQKFADKHHTLFLGRGAMYPVAKEGALKLKEISYIHAEAYSAGELKHGPLALVDDDMPVVAVAPRNDLLEKLKSNLQEVKARGGKLFVFADKDSGFKDEEGVTVIPVPHVPDSLEPIVYTIPLQLLSYHVAIIKGTDVDQPRNLAKSVTVE